MANRVKEDEKNERIIRGLLKLSPNRHCINCNTLGPQYVCTNFWTFVCTICSGIHREFTHRVKSVSMAKFSSDEVSALQQGGNECAKEVYFKEWDFQLQSLPDSSNILRLRDFIKHVYVDRRYTGKRSVAKTTRVDRKDSYTERNGSRRPPNEDTYEHRFVERFGSFGRYEERNSRYDYDARRGPGYDQESQKHGRGHFEVVDDRFRDDRSGSRKSDDVRFSERVHKLESRSTNKQEALDTSNPPVVCPVRDILGDNSPTLLVGVPPKANGARASYGSANVQRTTSSSMGPTNENSVELKRANLGGLIDFNADPEHVPQPQQTSISTCQSIAESTSLSIDNNWATFSMTTPEKASPPASNSNAMDSVLSQSPAAGVVFKGNVSVLPAISGGLTANVNNMPTLPGAGTAAASPASNIASSLGGSALSSTAVASSLPISSGGDSSSKANDTGQWTSMQQPQLSTFSVTASHCTQGSLSSPNLQSSQIVSKQTCDISSAAVSQSLPLEQNSRGRKELPEDLFTVTYSSVPGWQVVQPLGMAYGMQNPSVAVIHHVPAFRQPVKSTNPFDLNNEPNLGQAPMFPSMASLHGALPNVSAPTGLLRSSSLGSHSLQWLPPQSSHYVALPSQPLSYSSGIPSGAYMAQQIPRINQTPPGHQGVGAFGNSGVVFVNPNSGQQPGGIFSAPAISRSYSSVGGNPFG